MIIQGSNKPIFIELDTDVTEATAIEVSVWSKTGFQVKHWSRANIEVYKNVLKLNVTQKETSKFPVGSVKFRVKVLMNGYAEFFDEFDMDVIKFEDKTVMGSDTPPISSDDDDTDPSDIPILATRAWVGEHYATKENLLQKVGYAELVGDSLKLYSDSTKTNLIGSINLPSGGGSSSGSDWTESEIKAIIEAYGYITSSALTGYAHTSDIPSADISANTSARHTHSNKSVLDGITSQRVTEWNGKSTFSGSYNDLTNKPTLFDGNYDSLTNKPTIPTQVTDSHINDLIDAKLNGVETLLGGGF